MSKWARIEIYKNQTPHGSESLIMTEAYLQFQLFISSIFVEKEWKTKTDPNYITLQQCQAPMA